jgi:predicted nucleotidyltransferase
MQLYKKKDNIDLVIEQFFISPYRSFHIRELARLTKLNPNTVINVVSKLAKQKLILRKKTKAMVSLVANVDNSRFILAKKFYNFQALYSCGFVDALIEEFNNPELISCFGSYSRGEDFLESDIDILIISKKLDFQDFSKYSRKLSRKINIHVLSYEKMTKEFYKILLNAVKLHGFVRLNENF